MSIMNCVGANVTIEKIDFYQDNGKYYAKVSYILEDDHKKVRLKIPRINLPFEHLSEVILDNQTNECSVLFGYNCVLDAESYGKNKADGERFFTYEIIEKKPVKMTVEEIEKKLGYKVEIIS